MKAYVKISRWFVNDHNTMSKVIDSGFRLTNRVDAPLSDLSIFDIEGPGIEEPVEHVLTVDSQTGKVWATTFRPGL